MRILEWENCRIAGSCSYANVIKIQFWWHFVQKYMEYGAKNESLDECLRQDFFFHIHKSTGSIISILTSQKSQIHVWRTFARLNFLFIHEAMSEAEQRGEGLSVNLFMLDIYYI